jgi:hypothetical protein
VDGQVREVVRARSDAGVLAGVDDAVVMRQGKLARR